MIEKIKIYFSLFLLGLFLFPLVEKELHAWEHADDFHCNSSVAHIHQHEHSCNLCDYTVVEKVTPEYYKVAFVTYERNICFTPFFENVNIPSAFSDIPSRAPPVV